MGFTPGKSFNLMQKTTPADLSVYSSNLIRAHSEVIKLAMNSDKLEYDNDNCQWCDAKKHCPAFTGDMGEKMAAAFEPVPVDPAHEIVIPSVKTEVLSMPTQLPSPADVNPESVQHILAFKKVFDAWYKEFFEYQQDNAVDNTAPVGCKVVSGKKGNKKWAYDETEIMNYLTNMMAMQRQQVVNEKVKTPNSDR